MTHVCVVVVRLQIFLEYVIKNPLHEPQEPIDFPLFVEELDRYVLSLPCAR